MVQLKDYNNDWYKKQIGASFFKRGVWYYINLLVFNTYLFPVSFFKVLLLRLFGASIGKGVVIKPKVNIKYPWKLIVKDYSWIGEGVWIDNLAEVAIGSNVCISQGAFLLCGNHNYKDSKFGLKVNGIVLEDGVWVGAKAIVGPGVRISTHSVLAINSVATRNLEPYSIYQGNPAVKVRDREFDV